MRNYLNADYFFMVYNLIMYFSFSSKDFMCRQITGRKLDSINTFKDPD